ncbi:MAG TPA: uroporphyrinogen-III synthase [Chitinophagaceae bacterium]|nr:uroporphyrinogen-III synthase [Chitinophagaceae bacterium]
MPQNKVTILSTRAIDEAMIREAAKENIVVETTSFIQTEPISSVEIQQEIENALMLTTTVVFTSVNAVEAVAGELKGHQPDWQVFCIGHATRHAVERYFGKNLIAGTGANAGELAGIITKTAHPDEVIFFCGDQRRNELIDTLRSNDVDVNEVIVYQTIAVPHQLEKRYDGILFFSPSAVQSFFQKNKIDDQTVLFAIGNTTASELKNFTKNKIIVSSQPDTKYFLRNVILYFQENPVHH